MGLSCRVREVGEVTVLHLNGRISLGDALGLGRGHATRLHDLVREQVNEGRNKPLLSPLSRQSAATAVSSNFATQPDWSPPCGELLISTPY
jgi:hypothetical protein